jgi:hypothetical protein
MVTAMEPPVPVSSVQIASKGDDKLPPLLSMIVEGLPPYAESKYVHEAENYLKEQVKRYENPPSLDTYYRYGLVFAGYCHPGVISLDRLVALSTYYASLFLLDDLLFDDPDENLFEPYGIDRSVLSSPEKIREYLDHLAAVFGQQKSPRSPATLIETLMCEVGRDMLALSNPEWFEANLHLLYEYFHVSVAGHSDIVTGHNSYFQDLQSYTDMRAVIAGGKYILILTEFASDTYIPTVMRSDPYMQKMEIAAATHLAFANDVFSYHKESTVEENPRNLVTVLMACEGKSFVQAAQQAIELVNKYASSILDLEVEASDSVLQNHSRETRALVAGNVYYSCMCERYRQPDSVFPELRDMSTSWKAFLESSGGVVV